MAAPPQPARRLGTLLLAAALPPLFLHVSHRPHASVGSAEVDVADLLVLAAAAAAALTAARGGVRPLRAAAVVYLASGAFLAWIVVDTVLPHLRDDPYATREHFITAGKFAEYALLAVAVPLLVARVTDLRAPLAVLLAWGAAASAYGLVEIVTGIGIGPAGRRKPSFIGFHDFGAVSGAVLGIGLVALGLRLRHRLLTVGASAVGAVGVIVSGAISAVLGVLAAAGAVLLVGRLRRTLDRRRALAIVGLAAVVALGTAALRGPQVEAVLRFVGLAEKEPPSGGIESYAHRGVLAYIGFRVFLDHPVVGAGWQATTAEQATYGPYLADARRRFPNEPAEAFPSPEHPWGVQNAYIQALADLGLIGFAALGATLAAGLVVGLRAALRGPPAWAAVALTGVCWTLVAMGVLVGIGLVAGIALDAVLWLGLGLVAAGSTHA